MFVHEHRAVGRREASDQVCRLEERFVERLYLGVGRRLELKRSSRRHPPRAVEALFNDVRGIVSSHETFRLCMLDPCNGLETLA